MLLHKSNPGKASLRRYLGTGLPDERDSSLMGENEDNLEAHIFKLLYALPSHPLGLGSQFTRASMESRLSVFGRLCIWRVDAELSFSCGLLSSRQ